MVDNNVKTIVKDVTGSESVSALHALAYFVGQLSGIELSKSSISDDIDAENKDVFPGLRNLGI